MAKTESTQKPSRRAASRAFERAWKLLGKLEKRLAAARDEETKRRRQLAAATGDDLVRRHAQLNEAVANVGRIAALLTELSELIAANARAQGGQTVSDVAHAAADAVRDEERAKTAAGTPNSQLRPVRSAAPRAASARPRMLKAPASTPPSPKTPAAKPMTRRTRATKPATIRSSAAAPQAGLRPRPRRSLQPGTPDPDQSSS